ncbi:MAG: Ig-like domain-containing protein [Limisphaerales bacterium]
MIYRDLTLIRDGGNNLINQIVTVTPLNSTNYRIGEISWLQGYAGQYQLTVNASGISDFAGNPGVGSTNVSWQMILDTPATPANLAITPDLGFSATDGLTSTNPITLTGTVAATNVTVRLYDESASADLGTAIVNGTNFSASLLFNAQGTHRVKVTAVDIAGNVSPAAYFNIFLDLIRPAAVIGPVSSPTYSTVDSVTIAFSEGINPNTVSATNFSVTFNGTNTLTPTFALVSTNLVQLGGLGSATTGYGIYLVTANLKGIQDYAGNIATNLLTMTWERVSSNQPPVLAALTNLVITPDGVASYEIRATDPNGDSLTYSLAVGAPAGAEIVSTNGDFSWTPTRANASTTNLFTITVTDNGTPA